MAAFMEAAYSCFFYCVSVGVSVHRYLCAQAFFEKFECVDLKASKSPVCSSLVSRGVNVRDIINHFSVINTCYLRNNYLVVLNEAELHSFRLRLRNNSAGLFDLCW